MREKLQTPESETPKLPPYPLQKIGWCIRVQDASGLIGTVFCRTEPKPSEITRFNHVLESVQAHCMVEAVQRVFVAHDDFEIVRSLIGIADEMISLAERNEMR